MTRDVRYVTDASGSAGLSYEERADASAGWLLPVQLARRYRDPMLLDQALTKARRTDSSFSLIRTHIILMRYAGSSCKCW